MKKKFAMRLLAMICMIAFCVPAVITSVHAATAGDGQEPAVFILAFVNDQEDVIGTSAFYMEDTLGDGSTYLVSDGVTAAFIEDGYSCILMGLGYTERATYVTTSGNFAFYTAPGLENMEPMKTGGDLTAKVNVVYANMGEGGVTGAKSGGLDVSGWTSVCGGLYTPDVELQSVILLGAPVVETTGNTVVGSYSTTSEMEQAIVLLGGVEFPGEAVIVQGSNAVQQPAETQPLATLPQQEEPQQGDPQQEEPKQEEPETSNDTIFLIVVVALIAGAVVLNNNKKKKSPKTEAQTVARPVQEGTIMLDSGSNVPDPEDEMPLSGWQVRGLAGPLEGEVFVLPNLRTMKFGRDPGCSVAFSPNTPGISGMHCELRLDGSGVLLRDLQSSYGTYMGYNRVRLEPNVSYHLSEGDEFMLAEGGQVFRLERMGNEVQYYTPAVRSALDNTMYRADQNSRMVFGRDPRCQVIFDANESSVSSTHCVLYRENGVLYLMDKDSTNGTYFDEKQRLRPNVPYKVKKGMSFFLSSPKYTFVITED